MRRKSMVIFGAEERGGHVHTDGKPKHIQTTATGRKAGIGRDVHQRKDKHGKDKHGKDRRNDRTGKTRDREARREDTQSGKKLQNNSRQDKTSQDKIKDVNRFSFSFNSINNPICPNLLHSNYTISLNLAQSILLHMCSITVITVYI